MNDNTSGQNTIDVLEQHSLTITQFARACNVTETWVVQRVRGGVVPLAAEGPGAAAETGNGAPAAPGHEAGAPGTTAASPVTAVTDMVQGTDVTPAADMQAWRFSYHGIVRTRRIADLERTFDADPELAALTADLMEEVQQLRALLGHRR